MIIDLKEPNTRRYYVQCLGNIASAPVILGKFEPGLGKGLAYANSYLKGA